MVGAEELGRWAPLDVSEVVTLFRDAPFRWWLAGGHALEAHFDTSWRVHEDIDVGIVRADAPAIRDVLVGWDIHVASDGVLSPWDGQPLGQVSDSVGNLWCRPSPADPWALDLLIGEGNSTEWIYRRDRTVRRPWDQVILRTATNVPYLAPDIQLLFKSKTIRDKDQVDAVAAIAQLTTSRRSWLSEHLAPDHRWQSLVAAHRAQLALRNPANLEVAVTPLGSGRSSQAWQSLDGRVARVPIPNSGRVARYRSESLIGAHLSEAGHPVCRWETRSIDGITCSIGSLLKGSPIAYEADWSPSFAAQLAEVLRELHRLPCSGWGPLANSSTELVGTSDSEKQGVVDRWFHASVWPFDGSDFSTHPLVTLDPELARMVADLDRDILDALGGPRGVVHSDLHNQHILQIDGRLTGLLDFGDAFIGSIAWDFALIAWYYGAGNAGRFADAYQATTDTREQARRLAVAVGCYKVAKNPHDSAALNRLRALLRLLRNSAT